MSACDYCGSRVQMHEHMRVEPTSGWLDAIGLWCGVSGLGLWRGVSVGKGEVRDSEMVGCVRVLA